MTSITEEIEIRAPADEVFAAIVDFNGYDRWLSSSKPFRGMTHISSDPITVGTTWTEPSPQGVRHGTVTELQPPTRATFHQPMTMRPRLLGVIDSTVTIELIPTAAAVRVRRTVEIGIPWQLWLVRSTVGRRYREESARTLRALKSYVEAARSSPSE